MHTVFVYGTLKAGYSNHHLLETSEKATGTAITTGQYEMYHAGFPMVKNGNKNTGQIVGELYTVDDETLKRLDRLEGHPDFFCRHVVKVMMADKEVEAWMYMVPSVTERQPQYLPEHGQLFWPDCQRTQP